MWLTPPWLPDRTQCEAAWQSYIHDHLGHAWTALPPDLVAVGNLSVESVANCQTRLLRELFGGKYMFMSTHKNNN